MYYPAFILLATASLLGDAAVAQEERTDPSGVLDTVSRWLKALGDKTEEWIKPRVGSLRENGGIDWSGLVTSTREFQENYPVRPNVVVSIQSEFGRVQVETWENPVVRVRAEISVGAEKSETAEEIAGAIGIDVEVTTERIDVSTQYPDMRDRGRVVHEVNYILTVPANASILCTNTFGDTVIHGVTGTVGVDSQFGVVDLRNLAGSVSVRAKGDYPLHATGLREGGAFELRESQAEFLNVSGALKVNNFMGSVTLREFAPSCDIDVRNDNGPVHVYLPENRQPSVTVTTLYGSIQSDVPMDRTSQGALAFGSMIAMEAPQRLSIRTTFGDVFIHQEGLKPSPAAPTENGGEYVTRSVEDSAELGEVTRVRVKATLGDVRIEGVDSNRLEIRATKVVRMQVRDNAEKAIEALGLRVEPVDGELHITTAVRDNMEALGCTHYRVDLQIKCPSGVAVEVQAASGFTSIEKMTSSIRVDQAKGNVSLSDCTRDSGTFEVINETGDIIVSGCQGPMTLTSRQGSVRTANVYGPQSLNAELGSVLVDTPKGDVTVRGRGGDVNILALEGVLGEYNAQVEKGNLELVIPRTADASLWVTAKNGIPDSSVQLTGTMERGLYQGKGQLNSGQFRVDLIADGGNVYIYWPPE
jgi:hypothetical protein